MTIYTRRAKFDGRKTELDIENGVLTIPEGTKEAVIEDYKEIKQIVMPNSLEELWCCGNGIEVLRDFPQGLRELECCDNKLEALEDLPQEMEHLTCGGNAITRLSIPPKLLHLYCSDNLLTELFLPKGIEFVSCDGNSIKKLYVPSSVEFLDCCHNNMNHIFIAKGTDLRRQRYIDYSDGNPSLLRYSPIAYLQRAKKEVQPTRISASTTIRIVGIDVTQPLRSLAILIRFISLMAFRTSQQQ